MDMMLALRRLQMTNQEFSIKDESFINACRVVEIKPSRRQASKWRMKVGLAYKTKNKVT